MNERIKKLRKTLGFTQQEFAERIGIKRNTVAQYEIGRNEPIETVVTLICREFNVNYSWLKEGIGEMFVCGDIHSLDALAADQGASKEDVEFVRKYLELSADARKIVRSILKEVLS